MAKQTLTLEGVKSPVVITDKNYVAAGGEGTVFKKNGRAIKIYHPGKPVINERKIQELAKLTPKNILGPRGSVKDSKGKVIGFHSVFVDGAKPLCKLFTKDFRDKSGFDEQSTVSMVEIMQKTISQVHKEQCLIVDLNELNFLVDRNLKTPLFIDVDSWKTPSFPPTALMESVRDRLVKNYNFTELSDWFSFAIVSFQLYIGIHPYKGKHPDYKTKDWLKRMDDGVSIFDPKCIIPSSCRPMNAIPSSHLKWFEGVFKNNDRSIPPLPGDVGPMAVQIVMVQGNENFTTHFVSDYPDPILRVYHYGKENYVITRNNLYMTSRLRTSVCDLSGKKGKIAICDSPGNHPIVCLLQGKKLTLTEVLSSNPVAEVQADDIMVRDGRLYSVYGESIFEHQLHQGTKILHATRRVCGCLENSSQVFDGVIYQDALGKHTFVIPYREKSAFIGIVKEIEGYRVLDAKSEDNVLVVLTEKKGIYSRFIIVFEENFSSYTVRCVEDVPFESINFTKVPGGPCILVTDGDEIEIFVNNSKVKTLAKSPFDASMRLFNAGGKVCFINGKEIHSVSTK